MLKDTNTNQKFPIYEPKEKDIYSLEKTNFHPIEGIETWDFSEAVELKPGFLSFFIMRSILHESVIGEKITISNFNNLLKLQLYNLGFSKQFTDHFKGAFFPTLLEKTKHRKEPPELKFFQHYKDNSSFLHYKPERKKLFLTGGGTFDEKPSKIQETVEELFRIFDLDSKKGTFFLRTARNSYFYPLDPENRSRLFYVQEKNTIEIPFHFFYIHCE